MFKCILPRSILLFAILLVYVFFQQMGQARSEAPKTYTGSEACRECHEEEYNRFKAGAKKAYSYDHIKKLKKGLTDAEFRQCLECHTTGYGRPGGFRSEEETPHLKDAGCEVCHGPGSLHAASRDPQQIKGTLSIKDCETCHNSERVEAFRYKPMIYGGAH